jgi:hypothetical protein
MSANHDPRAPGSKYLRSGMNGYPGGVPYLTDKYINNDKSVNKTPGRKTNGSIRQTVITRTVDQNSINVDQFAFMDTKTADRPVLHNLQTINWMLASSAATGFVNSTGELGRVLGNPNAAQLKNYIVNSEAGIPLNIEDAEKAYIMNRFKLYGVVVNRDTDGGDSSKLQIARAFTCTVKNVCHVLDYFSVSGNSLRPYNSCFFVLKKVLIKENQSWEGVITAARNGSMSLKTATMEMINTQQWQIVPYHASNNVLAIEKRIWVNKDTGVPNIGGMWKVGRIHEYPDISVASAFEKRVDETVVARDVGVLTGRGRITPIHFYLNIQTFY